MLKDYMLDKGFTGVDNDGRLMVLLQGMGDRASGASTNIDHGFDSLWGGGRFQLRNLDDLGSGNWAWSTGSHTMVSGETFDVNVGDTGDEPGDLNQFKAYAMVFEEDNIDIANIDLYVRDHNCTGTGAQDLKADESYDVHSMVRIGATGHDKALCTRLVAKYITDLETRKVHWFRYYSHDTAMR